MMIKTWHVFLTLCFITIVTVATLSYLGRNVNIKMTVQKFKSKILNTNLTRIFRSEQWSKKTKDSLSHYMKTPSVTSFNKSKSDCKNLTVPNLEKFEYSWQTVSKDDMYLYSAFVDENRIRLVGIWMRTGRKRFCQLWFRENGTDEAIVKTCEAKITSISGGEGPGRFSTTYVICDLKGNHVPYAVSIIDGSEACANPQTLLPVYVPEVKEPKQFSICIPPMHGDFPPAYRLIEWIEINRYLGVQYFTFYNFNSKELVSNILEIYRKQGIVEILPWNLPTHNIHYLGQIASMHDCLDRNRKLFKYTGFFDLDEFVIPHAEQDMTWADLFHRLPASGCSYSFRSSFFVGNYTVVPYDINKLDSKFILEHSVVLNVLRRSTQIHLHHVRSKIIVKPEEVNTFGVHLTFSCKAGHPNRRVDPNIAMLHHYRSDGHTRETVGDNTTMKYQKSFQAALEKSPVISN